MTTDEFKKEILKKGLSVEETEMGIIVRIHITDSDIEGQGRKYGISKLFSYDAIKYLKYPQRVVEQLREELEEMIERDYKSIR